MKDQRLLLTPRVLCAAFVFVFFVLLAPATARAQGPYGGSGGSFLYTVQYGDTLSSIAARFGVSVQAIVQANGAARSNMYVGQRMYVSPGYSPSAYGSASTYMVQPGDTLYGIAQRYGVPMYTLMSMNHFYNPNYIYSGMRMQMPYTSYAAASYQSYVIRMGDTLSGIALRFGTSVYALMIANNIPDPNLIFAGMRLSIPTAQGYSYPSTQPYSQYPSSRYPTPMRMAPAPTSVPSSNTANVALQNIMFSPQSITVKVGTTIVWRNSETNGAQHTVTSGTPNAPSGLFDSGTLNPGQSFQFTINTPGTIAYYCRIHGAMMTGTVTVIP